MDHGGCRRPEHGATRRRRQRFALPCALALSGCAAAPLPGGPPADDTTAAVGRYRCGELEVEARYRDGYGAVELVADGRREMLPRVPAGSGLKYERGVDEGYRLFWSKGATARLALGSDAWWACRLRREDVSDGAGAQEPENIVLRALGNEPPWTLALGAVEARLERGYGPELVLLPRSAVLLAVDGTVLGEPIGVPELVVEAEGKLCRDDMSGMPYPLAVSLVIDAEKLFGCGGVPATLLVGATPAQTSAALAGAPRDAATDGRQWRVERIDGESVLAGAPATLRFDAAGGLSGTGGCNRFTGFWRLTGESLEIGGLAATRRACARPALRQESRLLALLADVRRFALSEDGALALVGADGEVIARRGADAAKGASR